MSGSIGMNVFRQDPFSGLTLTDQVNRNPYVPQALGELDIFEDTPIWTTAFQLNERNGQLFLIPTSARGAPLKQRPNDLRNARYFNVPRIGEEDTIYASQIQNLLADNPGQVFQSLQDEVARRLTGPTGLTMNRELTLEYHRLGAVQGVLLDSNGAVINNWFQEFGITPTPEFVLDLNVPVGTATGQLLPGVLRKMFNQIVRTMQTNGKGAFLPSTEVHALAGHQFFDALIAHPDVVQTYTNWASAENLRMNTAFKDFMFGGIIWHDYRGTDDQSTVAVPTNKAVFFPVKAPGVFKVAWAPGEGMADVNQKGKPMYVYRDIDPSEMQAWVRYQLISYPLHICTRPEMLLTATMDTTAD